MIIKIFKQCCGHGSAQIEKLSELLDKYGVDYDFHITTKTGNVGRKYLNRDQIVDNKIYVLFDNEIMEYEKCLKQIQN